MERSQFKVFPVSACMFLGITHTHTHPHTHTHNLPHKKRGKTAHWILSCSLRLVHIVAWSILGNSYPNSLATQDPNSLPRRGKKQWSICRLSLNFQWVMNGQAEPGLRAWAQSYPVQVEILDHGLLTAVIRVSWYPQASNFTICKIGIMVLISHKVFIKLKSGDPCKV